MIRLGLFLALFTFFILPAGCGSKPAPKPTVANTKPKKNSSRPVTTPSAPIPMPGDGFAEMRDKFNTPPTGTEPGAVPPAGGDISSVPVPPVPTGKPIEVGDPVVLTVPKDRAGNIAFLPDGRIISSSNAGAQIWSVDDPKNPQTLLVNGEPEKIARVAVSPEGDWIAGAGWQGGIHFWEISGKYSQKIEGEDGRCFGLEFSPSGKYMACCYEQPYLLLYDVARMAVIGKLETQGVEKYPSIAFSHDDTFVLAAWEKKLVVWTTADQQEQKDKGTNYSGPEKFGGFHDIAASPVSTEMVLSDGFHSHTTEVWDIAQWQPLGKLQKPGGESTNKFTYSLDGQWLAGVGIHGECGVWSVATRKKAFHLAGQPAISNDIAFSRDGRRVAVAGGHREIRVWTLPESK